MNHSTQNHWPGGKNLNKGKEKLSPKTSGSSGDKKKKSYKGKGKGKGKEKAPESANVYDISRLPDLSITSSESINFSCYKTGRKVEWFLNSGSTEHITPDNHDFVEYREFDTAEKAEITDRKFLTIEGYGTIITHGIMPNASVSIQIWHALYILEANKWLYSLIAAGQCNCVSTTTKQGTTVTQNGTPFIIGTPKSGNLCTVDMVLAKTEAKYLKWS